VRLEGQRIDNLPHESMRRIRGRKIGVIFQDPLTSLNPLYTIGQQLEETILTHLPLTKAQARQRALDLLREVGIPAPEARYGNYPHHFSGGMRQRVVIALALAAEPRLLIADEPTTALDVSIQAQIIALLKRLAAERGAAVMLITHDMGVIAETAQRVAVMYAGRIVEQAPANQLFADPVHPYAQGLIGALPPLDGPRRRLTAIPGTVPDPAKMPDGCAFAPRCALAEEACGIVAPSLAPIAEDRAVACVRAEASRRALLGIAAE
jgi:peptide/nickel transport system ATP-binding protein